LRNAFAASMAARMSAFSRMHDFGTCWSMRLLDTGMDMETITVTMTPWRNCWPTSAPGRHSAGDARPRFAGRAAGARIKRHWKPGAGRTASCLTFEIIYGHAFRRTQKPPAARVHRAVNLGKRLKIIFNKVTAGRMGVCYSSPPVENDAKLTDSEEK